MTMMRIGQWMATGKRGHGFSLERDGLTGWGDSVDVRREDVPRPMAHGSFDVPVYRGGRIVSASGLCRATSSEERAWFRSQLTGVLADGVSGQVIVEEDGQTLWANCRLAAGPKFSRFTFDKLARWQLQLWCADPRQFGEARTFAGGAPAFHYGNFPAPPVLTVSGSAAGGYTINGPSGKTFVVTKALVSGHPHTIDMATGRLTVDGVVQVGAVGRTQTWAIPPGQQVVMTSTAGTLTASVTDTFI